MAPDRSKAAPLLGPYGYNMAFQNLSKYLLPPRNAELLREVDAGQATLDDRDLMSEYNKRYFPIDRNKEMTAAIINARAHIATMSWAPKFYTEEQNFILHKADIVQLPFTPTAPYGIARITGYNMQERTASLEHVKRSAEIEISLLMDRNFGQQHVDRMMTSIATQAELTMTIRIQLAIVDIPYMEEIARLSHPTKGFSHARFRLLQADLVFLANHDSAVLLSRVSRLRNRDRPIDTFAVAHGDTDKFAVNGAESQPMPAFKIEYRSGFRDFLVDKYDGLNSYLSFRGGDGGLIALTENPETVITADQMGEHSAQTLRARVTLGEAAFMPVPNLLPGGLFSTNPDMLSVGVADQTDQQLVVRRLRYQEAAHFNYMFLNRTGYNDDASGPMSDTMGELVAYYNASDIRREQVYAFFRGKYRHYDNDTVPQNYYADGRHALDTMTGWRAVNGFVFWNDAMEMADLPTLVADVELKSLPHAHLDRIVLTLESLIPAAEIQKVNESDKTDAAAKDAAEEEEDVNDDDDDDVSAAAGTRKKTPGRKVQTRGSVTHDALALVQMHLSKYLPAINKFVKGGKGLKSLTSTAAGNKLPPKSKGRRPVAAADAAAAPSNKSVLSQVEAIGKATTADVLQGQWDLLNVLYDSKLPAVVIKALKDKANELHTATVTAIDDANAAYRTASAEKTEADKAKAATDAKDITAVTAATTRVTAANDDMDAAINQRALATARNEAAATLLTNVNKLKAPVGGLLASLVPFGLSADESLAAFKARHTLDTLRAQSDAVPAPWARLLRQSPDAALGDLVRIAHATAGDQASAAGHAALATLARHVEGKSPVLVAATLRKVADAVQTSPAALAQTAPWLTVNEERMANVQAAAAFGRGAPAMTLATHFLNASAAQDVDAMDIDLVAETPSSSSFSRAPPSGVLLGSLRLGNIYAPAVDAKGAARSEDRDADFRSDNVPADAAADEDEKKGKGINSYVRREREVFLFTNYPASQQVRRAIYVALVNSPFNADTTDALGSVGCTLMRFNYLRPFAQFITNSAVAFVSGPDTMVMGMGHFIMLTGIDDKRGSVAVHAEMRLGIICINPANLVLMPYVSCHQFLGPRNTAFLTSPDVARSDNLARPAIIAVPVPVTEVKHAMPLAMFESEAYPAPNTDAVVPLQKTSASLALRLWFGEDIINELTVFDDEGYGIDTKMATSLEQACSWFLDAKGKWMPHPGTGPLGFIGCNMPSAARIMNTGYGKFATEYDTTIVVH